MARLARAVLDSSDEDEFPDPALLGRPKMQPRRDKATEPIEMKAAPKTEKLAKEPAKVRIRKLGQASENALLRPWTRDSPASQTDAPDRPIPNAQTPRPRIELRARKPRAAVTVEPVEDEEDEFASAKEEVSIVEEVSVLHDSSESPDTEDSDFEEDEEDDSVVEIFPKRPLAKPRFFSNGRQTSQTAKGDSVAEDSFGSRKGMGEKARRKPTPDPPTTDSGNDLTNTFSRLNIDGLRDSVEPEKPKKQTGKATPPLTPPKGKPQKRLVSPTKLPRIPATPHRPSSDIFWSREFVDDWNDDHSPKKLLFPDPATTTTTTTTTTTATTEEEDMFKQPSGIPKKSPTVRKRYNDGPPKKEGLTPAPASAIISKRAAKKRFAQVKHEMAANFLRELDTVVTKGKISEMAASAGGIKIVWSKTLKTTAGRAHWRKETVRTCADDLTIRTICHHHASIELAEKIIDDEYRLLNTLAHEFCHLANFIVSGITKNPHGKEFKHWGQLCTRAFGDRGIKVTTKHSYEIDFKYVWECTGANCDILYKRQSKCIDPARQLCGACKGKLRQIKPVPRANAGGAPSEYQKFMKEQMKTLKKEYPMTPQKDIMRLVAIRWAETGKKAGGPKKEEEHVKAEDEDEDDDVSDRSFFEEAMEAVDYRSLPHRPREERSADISAT
ncbi:SprT-like family-domain-containing protein [Diplogelasinospora grovesii]|uniref:SprT-like family-domain-containing protein n=1 Tax=Diplogelasinospora grovesii TaxID=303347 RepID=A0AAN6ND85_9PEZI|nr:SprT-like family-domain-containing protein [Diplogelasinospora grovesii]